LFAGGLELDEEFEVVAEVAFGGIDASLEVAELLMDEGVGLSIVIGAVVGSTVEPNVPDVSFDFGEAAEVPGVADDVGDEGVLFGRSGEEAVEVGIAEGVEVGGVFAEEGGGFGEDAVFDGVEADGGFACGGARSGRFGGVAAVGVDLFLSGHVGSRWESLPEIK